MQQSETVHTSGLTGVLCPHSFLTERQMNIFGFLFQPSVIMLPWHMDSPFHESEESTSSAIRFVFPPQEMKPHAGFKKQLADFQIRLKDHYGYGCGAFLKAHSGRKNREEESSEIDRHLRGLPPPERAASFDHIQHWHMSLHLAQEIEIQQAQAERLLKRLKNQKSPLQGAMEAGEAFGLFKDLPGFGSDPAMSERELEHILLAWCGLFESCLPPNPTLITFKKGVWDLVSGIWEEPDDMQKPQKLLEIHLPDFGRHSFTPGTFCNPQLFQAFQTVLRTFQAKTGKAREELELAGHRMKAAMTGHPQSGKADLFFKFLQPLPEAKQSAGRKVLKSLFNKTFVFIQEVAGVGERKNRFEALSREGWKRKFIAAEPRLSEAVALYMQSGFDVHLEPLPKQNECASCVGVQGAEEGECQVCFEGMEDQYKIIFTRPGKGKQLPEEDLF